VLEARLQPCKVKAKLQSISLPGKIATPPGYTHGIAIGDSVAYV
jgi:hypothetical protein